MTTARMDAWHAQRVDRERAATRHLYWWLPDEASIRHATRILGMDRAAAIVAAFHSIHQRDPARWGGPGA